MKNKHIFLTITFLIAIIVLIFPLGSRAQVRQVFLLEKREDVLQARTTYKIICPLVASDGDIVDIKLKDYDENGSFIRENLLRRIFVTTDPFGRLPANITFDWIASPLPDNLLSHKWKPSCASNYFGEYENSYFIRIVNTAPLKVAYPNGGETLYAGKNYNFTWNQAGLTDSYNRIILRLRAYDLNGNRVADYAITTPSFGVPATPPSFPVTALNLPGFPVGPNYKYKIFAYRNVYPSFSSGVPGRQTISDESDNFFQILPVIKVASPVGGETLLANVASPITWTQTGLGNIRVDKSYLNFYLAAFDKDDYTPMGKFYLIKSLSQLPQTIPARTGKITWTPSKLIAGVNRPPDDVAAKAVYKILVKYEYQVGASKGAVEGRSDSYFDAIFTTDRSLVLTYPSGCKDAVVRKGSVCEIKWSSSGVGIVSLWVNEYQTFPDGSQFIARVPIDAVRASNAIFNWTVSSDLDIGDKYKIEIDQYDPGILQPLLVESANYFSIINPTAANFWQRFTATIFEAILKIFKK